ncbi:MAG TPA: peptidoglycan recognition protein [Actinomycetota bacterium]|nr:peptidoglycan recognition protein [Actinomycetota bacterium]
MTRRSLWIWPARLVIVAAAAASFLVPSWASPSRVISIPRTQALAMRFPGGHGSGFTSSMERFAFAPTHVGFVWTGTEGSAIHYRSLTNDGLSRWHLAPEADDLAHGDVHYSGVLAVDGATAMQWRASVPAGGEMGAVILDYMNTMDGPRVTERIPSIADASPRTPHIVTRAEWGADESIKSTSGGCQRHFYPVQQLFVHHTAGTNFDPHPKATMRAIYYFHTKVRGWCDIGYNFVIGPNGTVYEGRWARNYSPWETHTSESRTGLGVMGAHVLGFNAGSIGISLMGNFSLIRPPAAMRTSLAALLAWEADRHHLKPRGWHTYRSPDSRVKRWLPYIAGHRDANSTACPGTYLYAALPTMRKETAAVIGKGRADSSITVAASTNDVTYPQSVVLAGRLTTRSGKAIPFVHVRLYTRRTHHEWQETTVKTKADGSFKFPVAPRNKMKIRAVFHGDRKVWGSQSTLERVLVTPKIELHADGGVPDNSGVVHYPPGTASVDLSGSLAPPHPGLSVRVRVLRYESDGSKVRVSSVWTHLDAGRFGIEFTIPDPGTGTYGAVAMFPSDGDHTTARSQQVLFAIDPEP